MRVGEDIESGMLIDLDIRLDADCNDNRSEDPETWLHPEVTPEDINKEFRDLRAEVETLKSWLLSITLASYKHKEERDSALAEVEELKQENRLMAEDAGRG